MAAEGKKDVTVAVKMKVTDQMSSAAKKYQIQDSTLKKLISKEFKFEKKVETDPRKNPKRDLDSAMERLLTYAMGIVANGLDQLGSKNMDAKAQKKKEADCLSALEDIFKDMPKVCEEKLKDILSGKEDNKKAIAGGTKAFDKLAKLDTKGAFDKPRKALVAIFQSLEKELKRDGDKKSVTAEASKEIGAIMKEFADTGMEVANAAEFMLRTASSLKNDRKADSELVAFAKKVLKYQDALGGFEDEIDRFQELIEAAQEDLKGGEMKPEDARFFAKELNGMTEIESDGNQVADLVKKLKPEFEKIVKKLEAS